ncbi:MAG: response regulator [Caldisericaceae bacterium]|nr:response regulator [Caldisericaceae bacterium]
MNEQILIVEDSLSQRFFLEKVLTSEGFRVVSATNGKQALELLGQHKADLVLSDINMPEMGGIELTKSLKNNDTFKSIPVVLMTALNEPLEILQIIEAGADFLFLKEFEQGALSAFINDVLRNKSLVDQIRPKVILKSIYFGDERFLSTSDQQLLNLLLSTYRSALQAYQRYYHFKFEFNKLQKQLSHKNSTDINIDPTLLNSFISEFRTPLNNMLHLIDLLKTSNDQQEREIQAQLANINTDYLLTLLNDLQKAIDYQLKGELLPVSEIEFNLRDCIEDAVSPFVIKTGEKQIDLTVYIAPDLPFFIKSDPNYLKHLIFYVLDLIFLNLEKCSLLLEAIPAEEGQFQINFTFPKNEKLNAMFSTTNNHSPLAFFEYYRKNLKYKIQLKEAEADQQRIEVLVPFRKVEGRSEIQQSDLSNIRALICSDQWMSGLVLEELLKQWAMKVKVCNDLKKLDAFLLQAKQAGQPFQVLIFDARPNDDAHFELLKQIASSDQYPKPEIILLTNFGKPGDAKRSLESRIAAYLLKPVRSRELKKAIQAVLSKSKPDSGLVTRHSLKEAETPFRILVAEDNRVNQKLMLSVLKKSGFEVELATNGQEAVEMFKQKPFDLILMDMQMPVMDGYQATREIRRLETTRGSHTPIFALTASDDPKEIQGAIKAGMDMV